MYETPCTFESDEVSCVIIKCVAASKRALECRFEGINFHGGIAIILTTFNYFFGLMFIVDLGELMQYSKVF